MKYLVLTICILSIRFFSNAQSNRFEIKNAQPLTFGEIVENSKRYFNQQSLSESEKEEDNEANRFSRWEWYWQGRVQDDGLFPNLDSQSAIYRSLQHKSRFRHNNETWTNISQTSADGGYNGMGRLTSIAFHPTNPDIFFVGAPIGGIWKTTDGGNTWAAMGDSLPYVSVGNIAIHPQNPDSIYITVGDHQGWWNYGLGIYLSTDGGMTWNPTSQSTNFTNQDAFLRLLIDPVHPQHLWSAQSNGLFHSADGGSTWTLAQAGYHNDVAIKMDGSAIYTCRDDYWGSSEVFVSYDNGASWSMITSFNEPYAKNILALSPIEPSFVGIVHSVNGEGHWWVASDTLFNFQERSVVPDDWIIHCSPLFEQRIYCGGLNVHSSEDGGYNWAQQSMWYDVPEYPTVHADQRFVSHHPITKEIFFCNDGGLYKYNEINDQWTDLSNGLVITQFYRIAVSQQDETFMIGGTQDNGGRKRVGAGQWAATNGGDAMEVAVDTENDQVIYTTYTYGTLYRSNDQWGNDTYQEITPNQTTGGGWVTPYVIDPYDPATIVAGYEDVFVSHNHGNTWNKISNNLTGSVDYKISAVAIAPSDPSVIYASYKNRVYSTFDGGSTWGNHSAYLQGPTSGNITSIVVHPQDPMKLWVTVDGYQNNNKVRYSSNGSTTFSNFSLNLPNTPINCSIIDEESALFDLYIGTDLGVFVYNDSIADWQYYSSGIPNTSITDLAIQYPSRKLRAATFGRGIWETGLYSNSIIHVDNYEPNFPNWISLQNTLVTNQLQIDIHAQSTENVHLEILNLLGQVVSKSNLTLPMGNYQETKDISTLPSGEYLLRVTSSKFSGKAIRFVKQ
jgi:photosystem II stability/assembly factor-like uncharacterized protein